MTPDHETTSLTREALGIDIGGSSIKAALVNLESGKITASPHRSPLPTPSTPDTVSTMIKQLLDHFKWSGPLGCGYPGVVKNGVACSAANISHNWLGVNLENKFGELTTEEVRVINDADAAGLAEMRFGAGQIYDRDNGGTVLMLTFGTGIGSAFFRNGCLFPNTEFGHIYMKQGLEGEELAAGSVRAKEDLSWKDWGVRVNDYLIEMNKLVSPDLIIVGGGVSENFDLFKDYLSVDTCVVPARMTNDAGIIGAALAVNLTYQEQS